MAKLEIMQLLGRSQSVIVKVQCCERDGWKNKSIPSGEMRLEGGLGRLVTKILIGIFDMSFLYTYLASYLCT